MRADQSGQRLAALRSRLVDLELDGLVVTGPENIRYLSGFSGSLGYLVIGSGTAEILGDSRYWLQMEAEAPAFTLVRSGPSHALWALVS
jgi:Xaa-Pro aminopeptidase